jgi:hypothetical protein
MLSLDAGKDCVINFTEKSTNKKYLLWKLKVIHYLSVHCIQSIIYNNNNLTQSMYSIKSVVKFNDKNNFGNLL